MFQRLHFNDTIVLTHFNDTIVSVTKFKKVAYVSVLLHSKILFTYFHKLNTPKKNTYLLTH